MLTRAHRFEERFTRGGATRLATDSGHVVLCSGCSGAADRAHYGRDFVRVFLFGNEENANKIIVVDQYTYSI